MSFCHKPSKRQKKEKQSANLFAKTAFRFLQGFLKDGTFWRDSTRAKRSEPEQRDGNPPQKALGCEAAEKE